MTTQSEQGDALAEKLFPIVHGELNGGDTAHRAIATQYEVGVVLHALAKLSGFFLCSSSAATVASFERMVRQHRRQAAAEREAHQPAGTA